MKFSFDCKIRNCLFQMETLESALLESKLKANRELDQANMYAAELESKVMNFMKS